ncbi:MAG: hypothetical protein K2I03_12065 [Lachnospiraceae bacterium]|nr:hypothetical protein [Lachnospiraceae bacterium]
MLPFISKYYENKMNMKFEYQVKREGIDMYMRKSEEEKYKYISGNNVLIYFRKQEQK